MSARRATIAAAILLSSCTLFFFGASGRAGALTLLPVNFFARASLSATSAQADAGSYWSSLSADGRFVAFLSAATNLVPGDSNGHNDAFVKDRESASIARVSLADGGVETTGDPESIALSGGGRYAVFDSYAATLVVGDTNGVSDVFLHDRVSGKTVRVSVSSAEAQGNGDSYSPSVDFGGRYLAFQSFSSNLVDADTNGAHDVFVRDLSGGTTARVNVSSAGEQANGHTYPPFINSSGRYVAFSSHASNLVPGDTNGVADLFVHDRATGVTERVSVSNGGGESEAASYGGAIDGDGRYVAFESTSANLVAPDVGGWEDIFVRDRLAGTTHRVSVSTEGIPADGDSGGPVLGGDGRFVAFVSGSGNLTLGDPGAFDDVFVRDLRTGKVERVSTPGGGGEPDADCASPSLSADGRIVAFSSEATNLVEDDTNHAPDVFVIDRGPESFGSPFIDIAGSPYLGAIAGLADAGIVNGYTTGAGLEFRPQNPLYRAQFAKMMTGAWGLIVDEYLPVAFGDLGADVPDDLYPHEHVAVAAQHGVTQGMTPTTFGPYRNLTRAQLLTMVVRSLQKLAPGTLGTPPADWRGVLPFGDPTHGPNIRLAEYNGLLDGIELSGWDVWQDARRGETAQVLHNMRGMTD